MNNLVIGNTSQLSQYFPKDYIKISSRNIDFETIKLKKWNRVFLCFGESRKFISEKELYDEINFDYTLYVIDQLKDFCEKIIVYSTCELWNNVSGPIDINTPTNFHSTPYIESKYRITNYINSKREIYNNIIILYPFNFNSPYRSKNFLFGKIFYSLINFEKVEIGDTYFYRDIVHPKFVVSKSISANTDEIVGSGRLCFVNDFIKDLFNYFEVCYEDYIDEKEFDKYNEYNKKNEFYLHSKKCIYTYQNLLKDTIDDIKLFRKRND